MTEPTITQNCALYFALHRHTERSGARAQSWRKTRVDRLRNLRTPTIGQSIKGLGLSLADGKGTYSSIGRQLMQIKLGPIFKRES
jgi:hypothetical protein